MRALLRHSDGRHGDETWPVELGDVEREIRSGRLPADAALLHPPWTGDRFLPLGDIPAFADAFDSPDARFAARLRQRRFPWLSAGLGVAVVAAAVIQALLARQGTPWAEGVLARLLARWPVGFEPTLLDGRWWTAWSSQLLHHNLQHALFNAPILVYCGYRVEQALSASGALAVVAGAVLGGGALIAGLDTVPVIGASIAAYGLWGAQISLGVRMGDSIPRELRGCYGMGNFVFFVPLYVASLANPTLSHLGHLGGFLGGVAVAMLLPAETMAPARAVWRTRLRALSLAGLMALAPALAVAAAARLPGVAYGPYADVSVEDAGITIQLPERMASHPLDVGEMHGWRASGNGDAPLFADLFLAAEGADAGGAWLAGWWGEHLGGTAVALPAPEPLGPGWRAFAFRVDAGGRRWRVVEHQLWRGRYLVRAGYYSRSGFNLGGREALYRHALSTLAVADPPPLAEVRAQVEAEPTSPVLRYHYAAELHRAGEIALADAVLATLDGRTDGWQRAAAQARLKLWLEHPHLAGPERRPWVLAHLAAATDQDTVLKERARRWLAQTPETPPEAPTRTPAPVGTLSELPTASL